MFVHLQFVEDLRARIILKLVAQILFQRCVTLAAIEMALHIASIFNGASWGY